MLVVLSMLIDQIRAVFILRSKVDNPRSCSLVIESNHTDIYIDSTQKLADLGEL